MRPFLRSWITILFLNLFVVALLGVTLRYKILYPLPFMDQKSVLHSHSHFAFAGWITQSFMVLLVHRLALQMGESVLKKYRLLLNANLISAYGMLFSFIYQGYGQISISFSTLSIITSYFFAIYYWKDLNRLQKVQVSHYWIKASLLFNVLSSIGAFSLAFLMANKIIHQNWYLACIYFFLHFQYNGWFFFAGMGLLVSKMEHLTGVAKAMKQTFLLFAFACVPAYFLSALWLPFPMIVYWIVIAAAIAQLGGLSIILHTLHKNIQFISIHFSKAGKNLLLLSCIAFCIKILLQAGSVHPALSELSYGFRPIVIGYLHLVLLAVTSIFIIGYIISFELTHITKMLIFGALIFVSGIIINEILLMIQGIFAMNNIAVHEINYMLLFAALLLMTGAGILFLSQKFAGHKN